jgi:hypothetical protein
MKTEQKFRARGGMILGEDGYVVAELIRCNLAKRATAALNACDGIPTKALENGVIESLIKALISEMKESECTKGCIGFDKCAPGRHCALYEHAELIEEIKGRPFSELEEE